MIENHTLQYRQIACGSFNELYNRQLRNSATNCDPPTGSLENQIAQAHNYLKNYTDNDYSPITLETIKQKIDTWQTDINTLRSNGNNQVADKAQSDMFATLATFQQTLEQAHKNTLQQAQVAQSETQPPQPPVQEPPPPAPENPPLP